MENVIEDKNSSNSITTLDWHRKYGLFSCNKAGYVYEWDLRSGAVRNKYNVTVESKSKQGNTISAIKIVPHNQVSHILFLNRTYIFYPSDNRQCKIEFYIQ